MVTQGGHESGSGGGLVRDRLARGGLRLPEPLAAKGAYSRVRRIGDQAWVAGHTGRTPQGPLHVGTVGVDVSIEEARAEARAAALNVLAALDGAGLLDEVLGVVHARGFVRARPDFAEHPAVIDAMSEVLLAAFGAESGAHARTAIGVASLPGGAPVEVEAVFELAPRVGS